MIHIKNKKTYAGDGFYVGRPSPLGNPFKIDAKTSRHTAIEKYRAWLEERLKTENPTSKAFRGMADYYWEHGEMTLICWCAPIFPCHAEVIREFILSVVGDRG
jgi:hypothetical protein